ncbi:MAG: carboxymuconolactone decarboxylase family protein [Nitrospinae bacterium]|nr:carboxymuconolactone decarboxylase family protein [Nitrospinota bacterium]
MEEKFKELIAVGASLAANCHPCLRYHAGKAAEHGADELEIAQALEMGKAVRKGAASKTDAFAAQLTLAGAPANSAKEEGCGCGS